MLCCLHSGYLVYEYLDYHTWLCLTESFSVVCSMIRLVNVGKARASSLRTDINFCFIKSSFLGDSSQFIRLIMHSLFFVNMICCFQLLIMYILQ